MPSCPTCDTDLSLIKPSASNRNGKRYAGAWCERCKRAWRAFLPAPREGWRFIWNVGAGERDYVLNGHVVGG